MYLRGVQAVLLMCSFPICASLICEPHTGNCDQIGEPEAREVITQAFTVHEKQKEHWMLTEHQESTTPLSADKQTEDMPVISIINPPVKDEEKETTPETTEKDSKPKVEDAKNSKPKPKPKPKPEKPIAANTNKTVLSYPAMLFIFLAVLVIIFILFKLHGRHDSRPSTPTQPTQSTIRRVGDYRRVGPVSAEREAELRNLRIRKDRDEDDSETTETIPLTEMSSCNARQTFEAGPSTSAGLPLCSNETLAKKGRSTSSQEETSSDDNQSTRAGPSNDNQPIKESNDPLTDGPSNNQLINVEPFSNERSKSESSNSPKKMETSEKDLSLPSATKTTDEDVSVMEDQNSQNKNTHNTLAAAVSNESKQSSELSDDVFI